MCPFDKNRNIFKMSSFLIVMTIGQHNSFLYKSELSFASAVIDHEQEKGTVMK